MKYIFITIALFILIACDKIKLAEKEETSPEGTAYVKAGYFSQYVSANNVGVQMKFDGERVSNLFTSPTPYPGGGFNTGGNSFADYLSIAPGSRNLIISIPKAGTNTDSIVRFNGSVDLTAGTRQTIMLTDTAANTQATVIADDITPPQTGNFARAKFFNGMPGSTLDFYIRSSGGTLAAAKNIAYKGLSAYFDFPAGLSNDTLDIVTAGTNYTSSTTPLARYVWAQTSIIPGRVYTILSAGYSSIAYTTTDNRRARVSVVLNR
jgi:hypothetical protein